MESLCRSFLWKGTEVIHKKSPVAWDKICDPKTSGGLNVTSLVEWNQATLTKLLWNIQSKADKLWVRWIHVYYMKGDDVMSWRGQDKRSWIIKSILKCRTVVKNSS